MDHRGSGTALADNPRLDVRLPGLADRSPRRIVMDGRLRLPLDHDLVARAGAQSTLVFTHSGAEELRVRSYHEAGVEVVEIPTTTDEVLSVPDLLTILAAMGVTRLLVEGGARLAGSFMAEDLVDRIAWFRAGGVIGGDGLPAIAGFGLDRLQEMRKFSLYRTMGLAGDRLELFRRRD